jgi:CDP-glycerol glycerophosphotransferase (TagB/SpsB family)
MDEKTSMMAYSDVFVTVYSTMVVEATLHDRPVVAACIDHPVGWTKTFYLPLSKIGGWPTHSRFREAGAGRVALTEEELREHLNFYLENPEADQEARRDFIARELTYTDASAGRRVGEILLGLIEKGHYRK